MPLVRKNSKKRDAILTVLQGTDVHPTAEWVLQQLRPDYPDLSLGTVYRNLRLFKENGQAISVGIVNGQERFDGNTSPHAHFVCRCCGRVADVMEPPELGERYLLAVQEAAGGEVHAHSHLAYGICGDCLAAQKKK